MEQKTKPRVLAIIREAECIGCTKCIQACPVDAILGSEKHMHTVIAAECVGCKLCVEPCPVDCIEMITAPESMQELPQQAHQRKTLAKMRFRHRQERLAREKESYHLSQEYHSVTLKKNYIQEALARVKVKKQG